ncbi:MAG: hypothetical protein PHY16_11805 [Methylobacter sp.]|nr:hypothetical protein [Methylobacter sp.]
MRNILIKFPVKPAYLFASENGLEAEAIAIRKLPITWQRAYRTGVRRGYLADLFHQNNLLDKFIEEHWNEGHEDSEIKHLKFIEKLREDYIRYLEEKEPEEEDDYDDSDSLAIVMENHLRDFLSNNNLDKIEPGLKLIIAMELRDESFESIVEE